MLEGFPTEILSCMGCSQHGEIQSLLQKPLTLNCPKDHQPNLACLEEIKQKCTVCTNSLPFTQESISTPGLGQQRSRTTCSQFAPKAPAPQMPGWSNFPPTRASARLAFPQGHVWRVFRDSRLTNSVSPENPTTPGTAAVPPVVWLNHSCRG